MLRSERGTAIQLGSGARMRGGVRFLMYEYGVLIRNQS